MQGLKRRIVYVSSYEIIGMVISSVGLALLHKDLKCKAPLIEPNLRRNLDKWST